MLHFNQNMNRNESKWIEIKLNRAQANHSKETIREPGRANLRYKYQSEKHSTYHPSF